MSIGYEAKMVRNCRRSGMALTLLQNPCIISQASPVAVSRKRFHCMEWSETFGESTLGLVQCRRTVAARPPIVVTIRQSAMSDSNRHYLHLRAISIVAGEAFRQSMFHHDLPKANLEAQFSAPQLPQDEISI